MTFSLRLRALLAWAALVVVGCGGAGGLGITDGGPVGTGISASVVGNVVAVEDSDAFGDTASVALVSAATSDPGIGDLAALDDIEVSLDEFPDVSTSTDADGNFNLDGEFSGALTLRFRTDGLDVLQPIEVPTGGVVVLSDILLDEAGVTTEAGRPLDLVGRVRSIDCGAGTMLVEDRDDKRFDVTLIEETEYVRGSADAECVDVRENDTVSVDGLQGELERRSLTALSIEIDPDDSRPPRLERQVAVRGDLVAAHCDSSPERVVIDDGEQLIRIAVPADARIRTMQGRPLACGDLALGDRVTGQGILDLRQPGFLVGQTLIVGDRLGPGAELRISGFVAVADCDADAPILQVVGPGGEVVAVRILPSTTLRTPDGYSCERLRDDVSVRGKGVVSTDLPGGLDAVELRFKKVRRK